MDINEIKAPFASQGDMEDFPYEQDPDALLSWLTGYTYRYANKPEEDGIYIKREKFNKILNLVTAFMIQLKNNMPSIVDVENKLDKNEYYTDKPFFVTTNTQQSISEVKTFTKTPQCINNPVNANDLVRLAYLTSVGGVGLGFMQNYQILTNQRQSGITYTNTTNKPIFCILTIGDKDGTRPLDIYINGVLAIRYDDFGNKYERGNFSFIVPAGYTYKVETENFIYYWSELR